jgi:penicillin-binding protein 1A
MRRYLLISLAAAAGLGLIGLLTFGVYWAWFLCGPETCPSIEQFDEYRPRQPARLYAADGRFIGEVGLERRSVVTLDQIPKHVTDAFVITEDRRFYGHRGIDYPRILGAIIANIKARSFAEGFSTITMQLARNVWPEMTREKPLIRKFREMKVARRIEKRFSKERILELYLNQISLGSGAFGVEAASQRYFGRSVSQISVSEGAMLAAIPKAPSRYNPRRYPDRAVQRRNTVLELMRRAGALSDADASVAKASPLRLYRPARGTGEVAPYFVEWVRAELERRFGEQVYDQGLRVVTTLDLDMQGAAERAVERQLRAIEAIPEFTHLTYEAYLAREASGDVNPNRGNSPYIQGSFVALDPRTGAVRALVGGRDFEDSKFDRATRAVRQPGSTFKPIVYSTAIRTGRPTTYFLDDEPIEVPQLDGTLWTPQNYDLTFEGRVSLRSALIRSRNLPAIRLAMELGEGSVAEMAKNFGISTRVPAFPSIALGAADVYPIEMISAYSVFANLGWRVPPNPLLLVETLDGRKLYEADPQEERIQVLSREEAWIMVDMLKDAVRRGTGTAVWNSGFRTPSGGKTGTTNDNTDVWYVGFTTDLVAGAWMGFDQPQEIMPNAQGGRLAAPAWISFMREVYERKPTPPDWPRPPGILALEIDPETGLRAGLGCISDAIRIEYFLPGTEPTSECPRRGFFFP